MKSLFLSILALLIASGPALGMGRRRLVEPSQVTRVLCEATMIGGGGKSLLTIAIDNRTVQRIEAKTGYSEKYALSNFTLDPTYSRFEASGRLVSQGPTSPIRYDDGTIEITSDQVRFVTRAKWDASILAVLRSGQVTFNERYEARCELLNGA